MKRSVSLAIHRPAGAGAPGGGDPGGTEVLLVQRPADDEDLPLVWGLPAASLRPGESWAAAVRRAARDKLGIEVAPGEVLREGSIERPSHTLAMRLYQARITRGEPSVPQPVEGVTQYRAWRWGEAAELVPAARSGSLCSRLYLEWRDAPPEAATRP